MAQLVLDNKAVFYAKILTMLPYNNKRFCYQALPFKEFKQ